VSVCLSPTGIVCRTSVHLFCSGLPGNHKCTVCTDMRHLTTWIRSENSAYAVVLSFLVYLSIVSHVIGVFILRAYKLNARFTNLLYFSNVDIVMQFRKLESFIRTFPRVRFGVIKVMTFVLLRSVISYVGTIFSYEYLYTYTKPYGVTSQKTAV
jgi:hypothetical protein